jgi:hypothetical protein
MKLFKYRGHHIWGGEWTDVWTWKIPIGLKWIDNGFVVPYFIRRFLKV